MPPTERAVAVEHALHPGRNRLEETRRGFSPAILAAGRQGVEAREIANRA
jgi:hypothetical protein